MGAAELAGGGVLDQLLRKPRERRAGGDDRLPRPIDDQQIGLFADLVRLRDVDQRLAIADQPHGAQRACIGPRSAGQRRGEHYGRSTRRAHDRDRLPRPRSSGGSGPARRQRAIDPPPVGPFDLSPQALAPFAVDDRDRQHPQIRPGAEVLAKQLLRFGPGRLGEGRVAGHSFGERSTHREKRTDPFGGRIGGERVSPQHLVFDRPAVQIRKTERDDAERQEADRRERHEGPGEQPGAKAHDEPAKERLRRGRHGGKYRRG